MDNQASKDLFKQVRIAYRLSASYYKRIHQLIRDVTSDEQLGLEYFIWGPAEFSYINGRNAKVLDYYSWNLLPGGITHYLFINGSKDIPQIPGEWMLAMYFISDTAVFDEVMQDNLDLDASDTCRSNPPYPYTFSLSVSRLANRQVCIRVTACTTVASMDAGVKPRVCPMSEASALGTGTVGFMLLQNRHFRHPWRSYSRRVEQVDARRLTVFLKSVLRNGFPPSR
jgi:hypothetical protein